MELDARARTKIAFLNEKMDVIHRANRMYATPSEATGVPIVTSIRDQNSVYLWSQRT
jgi:hypothetical protein